MLIRFRKVTLHKQACKMLSKSWFATPHVDARFRKHPLKKHISGPAANQNQPFRMQTLFFAFTSSRNASVSQPIETQISTTHQNQPVPM